MMRIHATAVAKEGKAIVIVGPSGSGKSDLAFRLLDRGFDLVGDDQLIFQKHDNALMISGDPRLQGRFEIRGIGIAQIPFVSQAEAVLVIDLGEGVSRLPKLVHKSYLGLRVRKISLTPFEISAAQKAQWVFNEIVGL